MKLSYTLATSDTHDTKMLALRGDLHDNFDLIAKLGYHGAELMVRDPTELDPRQIAAWSHDAGIEIPAVSTGQLRAEDGLTLVAKEETVRRSAIDRMKKVIEFAAELEAQVNIGSLRGILPEGEARQAGLSRVRDSLMELLDHAAEHKVCLALEPQNRFTINWLNGVAETLDWIDQFAHSNLGLLFDIFHAGIEEPSISAGLIQSGSHLTHVQVSDTNRLPPGHGHANFPELFHVLRALNYSGYISVEVLQIPSPEVACRQAAESLLPLIRLSRSKTAGPSS